MLHYPIDKEGWTEFAEQGAQWWMKDFKRSDTGEAVLVIVNTYDPDFMYAWCVKGSLDKFMNDDVFLENIMNCDLGDDNIVTILVQAKWLKTLDQIAPPCKDGFFYVGYNVTNTGRMIDLEDGEDALAKFAKESGMPTATGVFFMEMED